MKIIKYKICTLVNHGTEEEQKIEEILYPVTMGWNEANEEIAKREAHNGEYEIIDDGVEEITQPTWQDRIEAQVAYNSMMLGTLIEEV